MITKKKTYKLETTGDTLNYSITSDSSCMSITPSEGTVASGTLVEFTFELQDETCFNSQVTLSIEDSEGCDTDDYIIALDNDCNISATLTNQPGTNNPYVFLVAVSTPTLYTTTWLYDEAVFSEKGSTNNSLELELINTNQLDNTEITATITDVNGCTEVLKYNYAFCNPVALNVTANLICIDELEIQSVTYKSGRLNIPISVTACSGKTIDYDTLTLSYDTAKLYATQSTNDESLIIVYAKKNTTSGDYNISYNIKDSDGLTSNTAIVKVRVPVCTVTNFPTVTPVTIELGPGDVPPNKVEIDLTDLVFKSNGDIDWSSFTFVENTGQTLVSANELTSSNGSAEFIAGDRRIDYTIGTQTENVDLVEYRLADVDSIYANRGLIYINYERQTAPVASADSYTVGKNTTTNMDILSNDTGDINFATLEIVAQPDLGIVFTNSDGTVDFIADNASGADSFTYRYYDVNGIVSNTATVSITIENSGTGTTSTICKSAGIDLEDYISGTFTAGGTWTKSVSNPSDLTITDPNNVDFSSALPGTYQFTYTLSEDETTITLIIADNGISLSSLSTFMQTVGASTYPVYRYRINITGIANNTNLYAILDYDGGTKFTTFYPSIFYPEGSIAELDVLLDDGAGDYDITIYGVDVCGVTDSFTTPTITI